jgi:hypothetical protein
MHGRWIEVDKRDYVIRVPKPLDTSAVWSSEPESLAVPSVLDLTETYWVETLPIEINELRVVVKAGIWTSLHGVDKTKATVHAIFQRDIAEMFSEKVWNEWD